MKKIEYYIKHSYFLQKIYKIVFSTFFKLIGLFIRIDNKMILFTGHSGRFNDSPKVIYDYFLNNKEYDSYKLIWGLNDKEIEAHRSLNYVKIYSLKYFLIALKSKYWIASVNIERGLKFKKKSQIYLNTWHGIPIKKIGNAATGRKDYDFSYIDYFICTSEYEKSIYIKDFKVKSSSLIMTGMPRNEILFQKYDNNVINTIKKRLGLDFKKKIILYAPTWRESSNNGSTYDIHLPIDQDKWRDKLSNDYIVLLRAHPYTTKLYLNHNKPFFIDVSSYEDVNDLIAISDLLISDYSAILFDYAITEKPMFCFAYDLDEYSINRGLYIDLTNEFPNGISQNEDQLLDKIINMNKDKLVNEIIKFKRKYIKVGKYSTKKSIEYIFRREKNE